MKRVLITFVLVAMLAMAVALPAGAAPAPSAKAFMIATESPLTPEQVTALQRAGANVRHVYKNFGGAAAMINPVNLERVRSLPFVTSVYPDQLYQLDAVQLPQLQTLPATPYWQDLINLESTGYTGRGVWVAVLDSGFYPNWRDYFTDAQILSEYGIAFNAANANPNVNQWEAGSDPHGMAVAATIVGFRYQDDTNEGGWGDGYATGAAGEYWVPGAAPDAQIIPVKVCEPIGCFGSAINAGVDYVTSLKKANPDQPIVINESLGGPSLDAVEKAALDAAISAGVVVVASAGNNGEAGMGFPGAYEPVISVGAGGWTDQWNEYPSKTWWLDDVPETGTDEVFVANFSSRARPGQFLDVVSAGRFLLLPYPCAMLYNDGQVTSGTEHRTCAAKATPDNASAAPYQYVFMSGTSFSAPAVAGVVALALEADPSLTNADAGFGALNDPASWGPGSLELLLEEASVDLADTGSITVTQRTGVQSPEAWDTTCGSGASAVTCDAVGSGWLLVDNLFNLLP